MATIRKRSNTWQAVVRRKGYPDNAKTFQTKVEANQWARSVESEMDKGQFVSRSLAEQTTFGDVIRRYMAAVTPGKRGRTEEAIRLTATLRHRITKLSMVNLTPEAMAGFRDERLKTCKANTVIRDLSVLSAIINHARREWGIVIQNPVEVIRKPSMPPGRDRVLSQAEEAVLLDQLKVRGRRNPLMQPMAILAIESAMRWGEILGIEWKHVDFEKCTVYLPLTKNRPSRVVPLSSRALQTLRSIPQSIPQTLETRVFPISIAAMEASFLGAVRRSNLHGLHFHDLRHTAATRMASKLPNVIELAAVTGHTSLQMLKRYYHPNAVELAKKLG